MLCTIAKVYHRLLAKAHTELQWQVLHCVLLCFSLGSTQFWCSSQSKTRKQSSVDRSVRIDERDMRDFLPWFIVQEIFVMDVCSKHSTAAKLRPGVEILHHRNCHRLIILAVNRTNRFSVVRATQTEIPRKHGLFQRILKLSSIAELAKQEILHYWAYIGSSNPS